MTLRHSCRPIILLVNVAMGLIGLSSLGFVVWGFGLFEELLVPVSMTVALAVASLLLLASIRNFKRELQKFRFELLVSALFTISLLAVVFGGRYDLPFLVLNGASLVASLPWLWLSWFIAAQNRLVLAGLITHAVALFAYLLILIVLPDGTLDVFLLPLPALSVVGVVWSPFLSQSMVCTARARHRPLLGPGMESLTMFIMVMPPTVLAVLIADALTNGPVWVTVAGVTAGLSFSSAVATPFRRFLRALGRLDEQQGG